MFCVLGSAFEFLILICFVFVIGLALVFGYCEFVTWFGYLLDYLDTTLDISGFVY